MWESLNISFEENTSKKIKHRKSKTAFDFSR
jgi:hypothetical protein